MRLSNNIENVETTGVSDQVNFSITASAKAFQILSDGLYSDKIRAIIRELACNAHDAHVAAGCPDRKFDVQFPTAMEPEFVIRDYGIGLSYDDVMHLYTTYFDSTKTQSNDFTGALGLGSKSPFSYTKSFTVISYHGGKKMTFTSFIGENGTPQCAHMFTEPSTEEVGLEVRFGVNDSDFYQFENRAQRVFRFFNNVPNITGIEFIQEEQTIIASGEGWRIIRNGRHHNGRVFVVQGNVGYPVNADSIKFADNETPIHKFLSLSNATVEIDFPIGELQFAASREELGYDDGTQKNLKDRTREIMAEIAAMVSDDIKDAKTLWEAHIKLHDITENYGQSLLDSLSDDFAPTWQGRPVHKEKLMVDLDEFSVSRGYTKWGGGKFDEDENTLDLMVSKFIEPSEGINWKKINDDRTYGRGAYTTHIFDRTGSKITIRPASRVTIIVDDVRKRGIYSRINNALQDAQWRKANNVQRQTLALFEFSNDNDQEALLNELGNPPVIKVSELPAKVVGNSRGDHNIFQCSFKGHNVRDRWTPETEIGLEDGGIYVELKAFIPYKANRDKWDNSLFRNIINDAVALGLLKDVSDVKGFRVAQVKEYELDKNPDWIEFGDFMRAEILKKLKWTRLGKKTVQSSSNRFGNREYKIDSLNAKNKNWDLLDKETDLWKFIEKIRDVNRDEIKLRVPKSFEKYNKANNNRYNVTWDIKLVEMARIMHINIHDEFVLEQDNLSKQYDEIATKYPMVCAIELDSYEHKRADLSNPKPVISQEPGNYRTDINDVMAWQLWDAVVNIKD